MWMLHCHDCAAAQSSIQAWVRHLTDCHALPTEWPSDRALRLTGAAAAKPYTTITESKKRRRQDSIPRPLNSFMLFAQHIRRNVLRVFNEASNAVLSQQLGLVWKSVPRAIKNRYDEEASKLVKIHQLEFPNYKYQPKKRSTVNLNDTIVPGNTQTSPESASEVQTPSRGYSPETLRFHDSAYSSRKNSCASSSQEISSTPPKPVFQAQQQVYHFQNQRPVVRQRFASATSSSKTVTPSVLSRQQRPVSCVLNPRTRVLKREHDPQSQTLYAGVTAKRRSYLFDSEIGTLSLPELFTTNQQNEMTLLGGRRGDEGEGEEEFSYFESTTESESMVSEENNLFFDETSSSLMELADFLPGAEELILGVEPLASGTLSPDLEMLDKEELLKL